MFRKLIAAALLVAAPVTASAHHGWSSYDAGKVLKLPTTFTELNWGNPHGTAKIRYQGATWDVILAPVTRMEARGLTREMVAPGQRITLEGYPRSDGAKEMRIERVIAGGKTVELR